MGLLWAVSTHLFTSQQKISACLKLKLCQLQFILFKIWLSPTFGKNDDAQNESKIFRKGKKHKFISCNFSYFCPTQFYVKTKQARIVLVIIFLFLSTLLLVKSVFFLLNRIYSSKSVASKFTLNKFNEKFWYKRKGEGVLRKMIFRSGTSCCCCCIQTI